jgi:hypothetical protein
MTESPEPEREMGRRVAPFGLPASLAALVLGALAGGWPVGWSAGLGVAIVTLNFVASCFSMARAASISLLAVAAVGMGGWVVRLGVIVALLFLLDQFDWFSALAFGLAVVPATVILLGFEMKLLAGGLGRELMVDPSKAAASKEMVG